MRVEVGLDLGRRLEPEKLHASQVTHDGPRTDLRGKINRALGVAHPLLVLIVLERGVFKQIWRRRINPSRQRTKITGDPDLDHPRLDDLQDARDQRDPNAVT